MALLVLLRGIRLFLSASGGQVRHKQLNLNLLILDTDCAKSADHDVSRGQLFSLGAFRSLFLLSFCVHHLIHFARQSLVGSLQLLILLFLCQEADFEFENLLFLALQLGFKLFEIRLVSFLHLILVLGFLVKTLKLPLALRL